MLLSLLENNILNHLMLLQSFESKHYYTQSADLNIFDLWMKRIVSCLAFEKGTH